MDFKRNLTRKITRERLSLFIEKYANSAYTLDIGCANSPYSKFFKNRVGFDIAEGPSVDVVGDAHTLPFEDSKFEQILCTEVLEHLHTPERAIAEMERVLKPGGTLLLTTRFLFPIHDAPHDYFRYTKYGLRHLLRNWEIVSLTEEVTTMETLGVLLQRIGFQTKLRANALSKICVFLIAKVFIAFNWLIVREYGDIRKSVEEQGIMSSGYFVVARKKVP